jgi:hypothetical protein
MSSQLLAARAGFAALILALLIAAGAVAAVRLGILPYATGLLAMAPATLLGLAALAASLWWARSAFARNEGDGKRLGLIALLGSIAFLYVPLGNLARQWTSPAINDVSSDPDDPPRFVALAKTRGPGMNSREPDPGRQVHFKGETNTAAYMLHTYYGTTSPHPITKPHGYLQKTKPQMFWHAFETVKKLGWRIMDYSPVDGRIEAVATSFWFGQKSDVVIGVRTAGTMGARIDARAQSEIGSRDFGGNLALLEDFFTTFRDGGF